MKPKRPSATKLRQKSYVRKGQEPQQQTIKHRTTTPTDATNTTKQSPRHQHTIFRKSTGHIW